MAIRTVSVDLRLDATTYLARGRQVVSINRDIDRTFSRLTSTSHAAAAGMDRAGDNMRQMGVRARLAERRVHDLREEINRLIAAQAALTAAGPIAAGAGAAGGVASAGGRMGNSVVRAVVAAFNSLPPQAQAAIGGSVALAIGVAAPAIGAAFGGALLTGLGAAGLGAGIASAIKNDTDVSAAFAGFGRQVSGSFATMGDAFAKPLIRSADLFRDRWASVAPEIRQMLNELSVAVMPLARGVAGFVERALPGLHEGLRGAVPVLTALGNELPRLGHAVGLFFALLADGSEGAADGLVALIRVLELSLFLLGGTVNYYAKIFSFIAGLPEPIKGLFGPLTLLAEKANLSGGEFSNMEFKVRGTADAIATLTATVESMNSVFLGQQNAAIAYERALDGLSESVKENGRSLDITREKGRQNREAILSGVEAAERQREANIKAGDTAQQAAGKYNAQIEQLRRTAINAGMARDEVERLIASIHRYPTGEKTLTYTVKTRFLTTGAHRPPPGMNGPIAYRHGGIQYARDGLLSLSGQAGIVTGGKPLTAFAEPGTGGEAFIARNAPHGRSLAIANEAARWHGGQVVPRGSVGGSVTNINLTVNAGLGADGRAVGQQVVDILRREVRARGGDVQVAIAGREKG